MSSPVRVRFAPSPTGSLHIGNIRAALFNYLFARQKNGKFVVRIEDTDVARNQNESEMKIIEDLRWLALRYDEGPLKGGKYAPYVQSQRTALYQEKLEELIAAQKVYRCFCSNEELEEKRVAALAHKVPPRYDRTCLRLSDDMIKAKIMQKVPFMWRLILNQDAIVEINDMAHGITKFELSHFSDVALTRPDGSFTFMFSNFVDDWLMNITHVIRGVDHLTNTAMQAAMFEAFALPLPTYWHLPFICDKEGKKLSKRDACSSLEDLRVRGFLPQAVCNYLAIIGASVGNEVQSLDELVSSFDFKHVHSTGSIRFDEEKLRWLNHKWLQRLSGAELLVYVRAYLNKTFSSCPHVPDEMLAYLIEKVKGDLTTLCDFPPALSFYFERPVISVEHLHSEVGADATTRALTLCKKHLHVLDQQNLFLELLKKDAQEVGLKARDLWRVVRYLLTGNFNGIAIADLLDMLTPAEVQERILKVEK